MWKSPFELYTYTFFQILIYSVCQISDIWMRNMKKIFLLKGPFIIFSFGKSLEHLDNCGLRRKFQGWRISHYVKISLILVINLGNFNFILERKFNKKVYLNFRITPEGVDVVLDCLCGEECNRGYGLLKPMGKYILFGSSNVVTGETKSFFSVARSVSILFTKVPSMKLT